MTKRRRALWALPFAILIAIVLWQTLTMRDPVYQRKPLRAWLGEAWDNGLDFPPAEQAVTAIGTEAIPSLLSLVQTKDSPIRQALMHLRDGNNKLPPMKLRSWREMQEMGAYGFRTLGPVAQPAVPELARLLESKDPYIRATAAFSLSLIGAPASNAAPAVTAYLRRLAKLGPGLPANPPERLCAIRALTEFGPAANPAIPDLITLTNDPDFGVRNAARAAVITIRHDSIMPLRETLRTVPGTPDWLQARAVLALLGTNAESAVPDLVLALQSTNHLVLDGVIWALVAIHSRPEISIPAVIPFLRSSNSWTRVPCLEVFGAFGTNAQNTPALPEILRHLQDPDLLVRRAATNALRRVKPEAIGP